MPENSDALYASGVTREEWFHAVLFFRKIADFDKCQLPVTSVGYSCGERNSP